MIWNRKKKFLALAVALGLTYGISLCAAAGAPAEFPSAPMGSQGMPQGEFPPPPPPGGMGKGMPEGKDVNDLAAACTIDGEDKKLAGLSLTAEKTDESAVLVRSGGGLLLTKATLSKTGDSSSADASNFTGQNAIVLVNNSTAILKDLELFSDADGANAIFATGENSHITVENTKIHTKNNSSRGLDATYGGSIAATDVEITTEGAHCGALATDRGEGTVMVTRSLLRTSGEGSPCIYSTGAITLTDSQGEATGSEIAVVEGKNSIALQNVALTGHQKHGVMLYQSFSGDAGVGEASFSAADSTLTNRSDGPMFYVTNTKATATLENTQLVQAGDILIQVTSDRWGNAGSNGGDFTFYGKKQKLSGAVLANAISKVALHLTDQSEWRGSINKDKAAGSASVHLSKDSTWTLTADSYVTSLTDEDSTFGNIKSNGHTIYYDSQKDKALNGKTIQLPDGGKITPMK